MQADNEAVRHSLLPGKTKLQSMSLRPLLTIGHAPQPIAQQHTSALDAFLL